jgi:hypothetical protein
MGNTFSCQKVESEEETIDRLFSTMNLNDIDTESAYEEFVKSITNKKLDLSLFESYLNRIIGDNTYSKVQYKYFNSMSQKHNNSENIKKLGLAIIMLSKGTNETKITCLFNHFNNFYKLQNKITDTFKVLPTLVQEFIMDIIENNTDYCLYAIQSSMEVEYINEIAQVWKKERMKNLFNSIYANFESLNFKYNKFHSPKKRSLSLIDGNSEEKLREKKKSTDIISDKKCITEFSYQIADKNYKDESEKIIHEFIELSFGQFIGSYIRNFLYEDYMKERTFEKVCF